MDSIDSMPMPTPSPPTQQSQSFVQHPLIQPQIPSIQPHLPSILPLRSITSSASEIPHHQPSYPHEGPSVISRAPSVPPPLPTQSSTAAPLRSHMLTPKSKPKRSSTKATRAGAPNYNTEDVTALLDCVEEVEPLGSNHWAIVASRFREWSVDNERPEREFDSLRNKFDKLANSKKKTGNPSCPEPVRRAKRIARAIQNKCAAMTLEGSSDEEETEVRAARTSVEEEVGRGAVVSGSTDDNQSEETLGSMKRKRKTAATGMRRTKCRGDDAIVEHIADMSAHIGVISKSLAAETAALSSNESLTKKDVVEIKKNEVRDSMAPTNSMLEQMNNLLQTIVARK